MKIFIPFFVCFVLLLGTREGYSFTREYFICPADSTEAVDSISVDSARVLMKAGEDDTTFIVLDVRTEKEFNEGHISDVFSLDFMSGTFRSDIHKLDKNYTYLIYCHSGKRSKRASIIMKEAGISKVLTMSGGIKEWMRLNYPVVK